MSGWCTSLARGTLLLTSLAGCASAADLPMSAAAFYARPGAVTQRQHQAIRKPQPRVAKLLRAVIAELPADVRSAALRPTLD